MKIAVGTKKGLWFAHGEARSWDVTGPRLPAHEVPSLAWVGERLLVGTRSEHWGPGVSSTTDLGTTWSEPEDGAIVFPEDTGAALERVWQIQPDPARADVVWAGCEPTSLWRSADGGKHFDLVRGLWDHPHRPDWAPGFGGAAVHTVLSDDSDDVLVAMSTGGVYRSADAGTTWAPSNKGISVPFMPGPEPEFGQCVHKVARDADGVRFYAQNHHGVYRSDDGGSTWQSIADGLPSDFGFVMLAHPRTAGTLWVVPLMADSDRVPPDGELQLHRSTDAGATWSRVGDGLPDRCYNVVLRDTACVVDGERAGVVIGTRDGRVFASDDDGETFAVAVDGLPDVLAVRAAP